MALLQEHIYHIKNVLSNGPVSDDFKISDEQVYFILKYARAKLIKDKFDKYHYINIANYQTIDCLKLELVPEINCPCFTNDCKVLRSKCELPRVITGRNGLLIQGIYDLSGNVISETSKSKLQYYKYSKTKQNRVSYYILNNHLYIQNADRLKAVSITALFEDPLALSSGLGECNSCGDNGSCYDPYTMDFPLDLDLTTYLNKMTYEELYGIMMKIPQDNNNNAKDDIKVSHE